MKRFLTTLFVLFYLLSYSQSNSEIIRWLNNFEDNNPVEKLMQGTLEDKVNLEYSNGSLIINSMIFNGMSTPPSKVRSIIKIADITQIEAQKSYYNSWVNVDFNICTKPGSIVMQIREPYSFEYKRWSNEVGWYRRYGYCDLNLRFRFYQTNANSQIDRVYNALRTLANNHGANPKIGSIF